MRLFQRIVHKKCIQTREQRDINIIGSWRESLAVCISAAYAAYTYHTVSNKRSVNRACLGDDFALTVVIYNLRFFCRVKLVLSPRMRP